MRAPDLRRSLKEALNTLDQEQVGGLEKIAYDLWLDALTAERDVLVKAVDIICKDCGKRHLYDIPVPVPDLTTRVRAMEVLLNQTYGKPAESLTVQVQVPSSLQELEALSTAELAALAAGDGVVEAEWEEA